MMKKTLVALAVVAASGASFAQVALTGNLSYSWQRGLDGTNGIANSDNSIFLSDTEDLGGGSKVVMSTGFDAGGRGSAANGSSFGNENSSLAVSGSLGTFTVTSYESDGPFAAIDGLSGASLQIGLFDASGITGGKRFREGVLYSSPDFSGVKLGLSYVTLAGQYVASDTLGSKTKVTPSITYEAGPLKAYLEYSLFNPSYNATAAGPSSADPVTQPTAYVTYDFGAAKVGAAWSKASNGDPYYGFGASVPAGALTFGLATFSGNASSTLGAATYTEGSVAYALGKRTSVKASFGQVNDSYNAISNASVATSNPYGLSGGFTQTSESRIGIYHSF